MKHAPEAGGFKAAAAKFFLIAVCAAFAVPYMPVNHFTATGREKLLFSCAMPNGYPFVTTYIHSLQLTPVKDDYRFSGGKIWQWEEWTQSHNAGLPSVTPPHAMLILSPPWMINRGGRAAFGVIYYRAGTERFGRNVWSLAPWDDINIYEKYPSYRIALETKIKPFKDAALRGFDTIKDVPDVNKHIFTM
jgi:hypothetical protein